MRNLIVILFVFVVEISFSQQNPPSLKWKQIKSEHTTLIFPQELARQAQEAAKRIDFLYDHQNKTLGGKPNRLPILLYNQTTVSNGYAALSPRRSVWYTTPMQEAVSLGSLDWLSLLSVHEYRHIAQYSASDRKFARILHFLWGERGWSFSQYSIPAWFYEGDAVCIETAFSKQGRGRLPIFTMPVRAQITTGKTYSYDKARFGSYKNYVPNHYSLGYLITSYARSNYGENLWNKTLLRTAKVPFWPYAFARSMRKYTKKNDKKMYDATMLHYDSLWQEKQDKIVETNVKLINSTRRKSYTNYFEPHYLPNGNVIALKTSLQKTTSIVIFDKNNSEKEILPISQQILSNPTQNKIVFTETTPDIRWQNRDYSDIVLYDFISGQRKKITQKGKYFAPALSPDGQQIVTVKYGADMQAELVVMDISGKIISVKKAKNKMFLRTPSWATNGEKIVYTISGNGGTTLAVWNIKNNKQTDVLSESFENIGRPIFWKDYILYNSPVSGIGNIYAVNIASHEKFQVTSRKLGAYNPSILADSLIFQDYTKDGYNIAKMILLPSKWVEISNLKNAEIQTYSELLKQENTGNLLDTTLLTQADFKVRNFNKLKGYKLHSWGIYPTGSDTKFELLGDNLLNTVSTSFSGTYDNIQKGWQSNASILFSKFFPVFSLGLSSNQRKTDYFPSSGDTLSIKWNEKIVSAGMLFPFDFSNDIYAKGLNINMNYQYIKSENKRFRTITEFYTGNFTTLSLSAIYYLLRVKALRDIYPKFGFSSTINFEFAPNKNNAEGAIFSAKVLGYLPGFFTNHSLKLRATFEKQASFTSQMNNYYYFASTVRVARGFTSIFSDQNTAFSADYIFPLWYPDVNLGSLLYIKGFRATLFGDISISRLHNDIFNSSIWARQTNTSTGAELYMQFHIFRLDFPFEIGARVSYTLLPTQEIIPEIIIMGINF